ncbi:hypothetical protein ACIQCD_30775 [Streptomyces sp. NPDC093250]
MAAPVAAQWFTVGELCTEQLGRHEVALSCGDPPGDQLGRAIEVEKEDA